MSTKNRELPIKDSRNFFIALDVPDLACAQRLISILPEAHKYYKIGMELFYKEGPYLLEYMSHKGKSLFLDLKLFDIPNTIAGAIRSLANHPFFMINIHLLGGEKMAQKAVETLHSINSKALLIGVTILTSFDQKIISQLLPANTEIERKARESLDIESWAVQLANYAQQWGLDGVVCSPWETIKIKAECGNDFVTVTPGVRFHANKDEDQKRVASPQEIQHLKCDFPVIGRPIIGHKESTQILKSYNNFLKAFTQ